MDDTSPEIELLLKARFASMTGSERAFMALQMFETAREIVLSSLDPALSDYQRRRLLWRRGSTFRGHERLPARTGRQPFGTITLRPLK